MECIIVYHYPSHVEGSVNKYHSVLSIDCERCHGPGQIHVMEKCLELLLTLLSILTTQ